MARTSAPRPRSAPQTPTAELLDPRVREVVRKRGFTEFSEAQEQSIPRLLAGDNLILVAPTGTGKTESAMLPVFDRLLETPGPGFKALYITPLRSLNRDILARMEWWCRELSLTAGVRHGDTPQNERRKQALNAPDLLITTPESLQALFMGKRLREHLKNVRYVIIDEIHDLAESKRGAQLAVALERLAEYAGEFQRIGLSATVGNPDEIGRFLCGARPFSVVEVPVASNLDITVRFAGEDFGDQVRTVERCLDAPGSTLVFVNTRVTAEALGHSLYSTGGCRGSPRFALAGCPGGRRGAVQARGDPGADRDLLDGAWHRYRAYRARPPVWLPKGGIAPGAAGRPGRPPSRRGIARNRSCDRV